MPLVVGRSCEKLSNIFHTTKGDSWRFDAIFRAMFVRAPGFMGRAKEAPHPRPHTVGPPPTCFSYYFFLEGSVCEKRMIIFAIGAEKSIFP